jgi:hypothetical protein
MSRLRFRFALIVGGLLFAFYLPSSTGGIISRPLSAVSLLGTCAILALLITSQRSTVPLPLVGAALSVPGLLLAFTVTSPFYEFSSGVFVIYTWLTLLYLIDLRDRFEMRWPERVLAVVSGVSLVFGYALVLNVAAADRLAQQLYSGFYPALLYIMVGLNDKPVLTFATHSMAGFMIYLLCYMVLSAYRVHGGPWRLGIAAGYLGLLIALRSTTGTMFAAITMPQMLVLVLRRHPRLTAPAGLVVLLGAVATLLWLGITADVVGAAIRDAVVGDRVRGLFSRYSEEGLLASNFAYFSRAPLSPIGLTATETLYLGDSGLVVNLLRGSVPLMVTVYGGLFLFLRFNLRRRATATWLWWVIVLFEVGFTPLQYFRFTAFVPFLVVYLNSVGAPPEWPAAAGLAGSGGRGTSPVAPARCDSPVDRDSMRRPPNHDDPTTPASGPGPHLENHDVT